MLSLLLALTAHAACTDADTDTVCDRVLDTIDGLHAPGEVLTLTLTGVEEGEVVAFLVSTSESGRQTCHPSGWFCSDLHRASLLAKEPADDSGALSVEVTLPDTWEDGTVAWVQAVAIDTATKTGTLSAVQELLVNGSPDRHAFMTEVVYEQGVDFRSALDADALCQAEADAASLGGTFMAWLSDETGDSPFTRFEDGGAWVRPDGELVAIGFDDLLDGPRITLAMTADGGAPFGNVVWTGTDVYGRADRTCSSWTDTESGTYGTYGVSDYTRYDDDADGWTDNGPRPCDFAPKGYLYCFAQ